MCLFLKFICYDSGAHVYICGDARYMAKDVHEALRLAIAGDVGELFIIIIIILVRKTNVHLVLNIFSNRKNPIQNN